MRLLITRPEEDAGPLAARLRELGHESLIAPMMRIDAVPGARVDLAGVQALLVTSANGARALAVATDDRERPVLAVGDASAKAARAAGFRRVDSAGGDVEDLARLVAARLSPADGAVLHAAGSKVAGDLSGRLTGAGFTFRRQVLYEARPVAALGPRTEAALGGRRIDGVLFFSPRTAEIFVSLAAAAGLGECLGACVAFCLSRAVADRAGALTWAEVRVAALPDQDSLVACLGDYQTEREP